MSQQLYNQQIQRYFTFPVKIISNTLYFKLSQKMNFFVCVISLDWIVPKASGRIYFCIFIWQQSNHEIQSFMSWVFTWKLHHLQTVIIFKTFLICILPIFVSADCIGQNFQNYVKRRSTTKHTYLVRDFNENVTSISPKLVQHFLYFPQNKCCSFLPNYSRALLQFWHQPLFFLRSYWVL